MFMKGMKKLKEELLFSEKIRLWQKFKQENQLENPSAQYLKERPKNVLNFAV